MTYPVLPGLTYDGQLYENPEMGTVEAVIPPGPPRHLPLPGHPGAAERRHPVLLVRGHL